MTSNDYIRAKRMGGKAFRRALTEGRYPYLPALDEIIPRRQELKTESIGVCEVPAELFAGTITLSRQEAFAENFMPLLPQDSEFAAKWDHVLEYQNADGISDPVKVCEFLGRFYAAEGNKRISVLRYLESPMIPADITRIIPPDLHTKENRVYDEFLRFFRCTRSYDVMFSEPGSYERLAGMLGLDLEHSWPEETVRRVKSACFRFSKIYRAMGGERMRLKAHDAFLIYADVYGACSLTGETDKEIRHRIRHIWPEDGLKTGMSRIVFFRTPNIRRTGKRLVSVFRGRKSRSGRNPVRIPKISSLRPCRLWYHKTGRIQYDQESSSGRYSGHRSDI